MKISYDATTENGIQYITSLYSRNTKYYTIVNRLDKMTPHYEEILTGDSVKSYQVGQGGTRSVTFNTVDPEAFMEKYENLEAAKVAMESNAKPRKAVGVIPRDF